MEKTDIYKELSEIRNDIEKHRKIHENSKYYKENEDFIISKLPEVSFKDFIEKE